ncbi:hypothetical protein FI667_g12241, partial [Globisporangium splendens]
MGISRDPFPARGATSEGQKQEENARGARHFSEMPHIIRLHVRSPGFFSAFLVPIPPTGLRKGFPIGFFPRLKDDSQNWLECTVVYIAEQCIKNVTIARTTNESTEYEEQQQQQQRPANAHPSPVPASVNAFALRKQFEAKLVSLQRGMEHVQHCRAGDACGMSASAECDLDPWTNRGMQGLQALGLPHDETHPDGGDRALAPPAHPLARRSQFLVFVPNSGVVDHDDGCAPPQRFLGAQPHPRGAARSASPLGTPSLLEIRFSCMAGVNGSGSLKVMKATRATKLKKKRERESENQRQGCMSLLYNPSSANLKNERKKTIPVAHKIQ